MLLPLLIIFFLCFFFIWFIYEKSKRKTFAVTPGLQTHSVEETDKEWVLYHNNFSLCSRKIRIALAEYNIQYNLFI